MILVLCSFGIFVGYVSGYLCIILLLGKEWLEGVDVMYVWVWVWVGCDVGWLEFDLINNIFVG